MWNSNVSLKSVVQFICEKGGVVKISELCDGELFPSENDAKDCFKIYRQYFKLDCNDGNTEVHALIPVKLCDKYDWKKHNCPLPECSNLHLCYNHVRGDCKYGERCKNNHDVHAAHNQKVFEAHQLGDFDDDLIMKLLKLSCVDKATAKGKKTPKEKPTPKEKTTPRDKTALSTVPKACIHYNSTNGCKNDNKCTFLHVCKFFIEGSCKFANECKRSHSIRDRQPLTVLRKLGFDTSQDASDLMKLLQNKSDKTRGETGRDDKQRGRVDDKQSGMVNKQRRRDDKQKQSGDVGNSATSSTLASKTSLNTHGVVNQEKYLCIFHLSGQCQYEDKCFNLHTDEPFQWQFLNGKVWKNFDKDDNMQIEKTFCNPMEDRTPVTNVQNIYKNKKVTGEVDVTSMKISLSNRDHNIRRVPTKVENQGWKQAFSPKWLWYWKDDNGTYVEYGKQSNLGATSAIDSSKLEESYAQFLGGNHEGKMQFETGRFSYEICFKDMKQINTQTKKERQLNRRPVLICKEDANAAAKRYRDKPSDYSVPDTWDLAVTSSEAEGFQLCLLTSSCDEYKDVERRFTTTLSSTASAKVIAIKRVQNKELWDDFRRKQTKMEKKNGSVELKPELLFHGTTNRVIPAICQQGFDHRLSGTQVGAMYGNGSYFHKSASYSDDYAQLDSSGYKHMFLNSVLVGSYTNGTQDLRRPPPKDPNAPLEDFYDTCVDNVSNPSIFVVFDNHQAYPQYIITYKPQ